MLVFSYHDESTAIPLIEIYKAFEGEREQGSQDYCPVLLVGTTGEDHLYSMTCIMCTGRFESFLSFMVDAGGRGGLC